MCIFNTLNMNLSKIKEQKEIEKKKCEMFSRLRKEIIRSKVSQEVTCYDLQSQIQILEEINKKKKEKMVIIQKECVDLSGRLDDEIRHRNETINKVKNTINLTEFLKKMVIELNETLSRCQSDNTALSLALEKCTQEGKAIKEEFKKQEQQTKDTISILEEKLQYQTESEKKMLEGLNSQKSILEGELKECKRTLLKYENTIMDLNKQNDEFKIQLTHNKQEFEKISVAFKNKEKELEDSKKLIDNLFTDTQMKTNMLEDLSKSNENLKRKLKNNKASTASLLEQNNGLSDTLSEMKGQHLTLTKEFKSLKSARDGAIAATENLKVTVAQLVEEKKQLEGTICEKNGEILNLKKECENTAQLVVQMKALQKDFEMKNNLLLDGKNAIAGITEELSNKNREYANERLAFGQSLSALEKVNEEKTATIESLQAELKRVTDELTNCKMDRDRAQASHAHSVAQKEKLNLDVTGGERGEEELMDMEDLNQQGDPTNDILPPRLWLRLEKLFPPQSSSSLLAYDDKYKYVSDESDDQDDYHKPVAPKKRRRQDSKSSVKKLEKERKTTKKCTKKSDVQTGLL